jgi:hypothetical protein
MVLVSSEMLHSAMLSTFCRFLAMISFFSDIQCLCVHAKTVNVGVAAGGCYLMPVCMQ